MAKSRKKFKGFVVFFLILVIAGAGYYVYSFGPFSILNSFYKPKNVTQIGGILTWDKMEHFSSYEIYADGDLIATTDETICDLNSFLDDSAKYDITVYGIDKKGKKSGESQAVNFESIKKDGDIYSSFNDYKTSNSITGDIIINDSNTIIDFSSSEDSEETTGLIYITSKAKRLTIKSNSVYTLKNANFVFQTRTGKFILELENINILGSSSRPDVISYKNDSDKTQSNFEFVLIGYGVNNSITSNYKAANGSKGSGDGWLTHAGNGGNGANGGNGINLDTIIIIGESDFSFTGTNGGKGGDGGDATYGSLNSHGSGGNGGNGGNGIKCVNLYIYLDETATLTANGGFGGEGGAEGINGFGSGRSPGSKGARGKGISGTITNYSGEIDTQDD